MVRRIKICNDFQGMMVHQYDSGQIIIYALKVCQLIDVWYMQYIYHSFQINNSVLFNFLWVTTDRWHLLETTWFIIINVNKHVAYRYLLCQKGNHTVFLPRIFSSTSNIFYAHVFKKTWCQYAWLVAYFAPNYQNIRRWSVFNKAWLNDMYQQFCKHTYVILNKIFPRKSPVVFSLSLYRESWANIHGTMEAGHLIGCN